MYARRAQLLAEQPSVGPDPDFVADIETTGPGEFFTWICQTSGTYNATIDYGDGSPVETITSYNDPNLGHTYATPGIHRQRISGEMGGLRFAGDANGDKVQRILSFGDSVFTASFDNALDGSSSLKHVDAGVLGTISHRRSFRSCSGLLTFYANKIGTGRCDEFLYNCQALTEIGDVDFSGATRMDNAFSLCPSLTTVGNVLLGSGSFDSMFSGCTSLQNLSALDYSGGTAFTNAFSGIAIATFDAIAMGSGNYQRAFNGCTNLVTVGNVDFSPGGAFREIFRFCSSLRNFPSNAFDTCLATDFSNAFPSCDLTQQSVDNVLISVDTAGQSNGTLGLAGGTSASPGPAGLAAKASLESRGWSVATN